MLALRPKRVNFDEVWGNLSNSVAKLITLKKLERRIWDSNFYDIYCLCVALPEPLSDRLYQETKDSLEQHVEALYSKVSSQVGMQLLMSYFEYWKIYYEGSKYIHCLYGYLNKQHIKRQKYADADLTYGGLTVDQIRNSMLEIGELALDIWRRKMIHALENELVRQLLDAIAADRRSEIAVSQEVVYGVIQSFVDVEEYRARNQLELYQTLFESKFLEATSDYYKREASLLLQDFNASVYMEKVMNRIEEENLRGKRFLHSSSYDKVTRMCQDVMVAAHQERLHSVSKEMVKHQQTHDLRNMYILLKPIPEGLAVLKKEFQDYAQEMAKNCIDSLTADTNIPAREIPERFMENILKVHEKIRETVESVFQKDPGFAAAMGHAMHTALNHKEGNTVVPKASDWLARYTDILLRRSLKGLTESEVEQKLNAVIDIFRFVEDKDIFQRFYSHGLANRLTLGVSVSLDAEESLINKLKNACGYEYTSKLQRMYTDMSTSTELTKKFNEFLVKEGRKLELEMQVMVLQAGAWPLTVYDESFVVPPELQPSIAAFEEFYGGRVSGRRLRWLYHIATGEVKFNYLDKPYLVTMTVPQLAVLQLFESHDICTFAELQAHTGLTIESLRRVANSLTTAGFLKTDGEDKNFNDNTVFRLHMQFTNKRLRFRIPAPKEEKKTEEVKRTEDLVDKERNYFLQCMICRIMKARKVMRHTCLVDEVLTQSKPRFRPEVARVKATIEKLIEQDYLERVEGKDEYAYKA